jgi:hypothetical protein
MDAILVANADFSSIRFEIFDVDEKWMLRRLVKGKFAIGGRPRLFAKARTMDH